MAKAPDIPTTAEGLAKEEAKLRQAIADARLSHALQKLESPATLRTMRARLARVLTMQRQLTKEKT